MSCAHARETRDESLTGDEKPHAFFTAQRGPHAISNASDAAASCDAILPDRDDEPAFISEHDGFLIATDRLGHPLLKALRRLTRKPVISSAEASLLTAQMLGDEPFGVLPSPGWPERHVLNYAIIDCLGARVSKNIPMVGLNRPDIKGDAGKVALELVERGVQTLCVIDPATNSGAIERMLQSKGNDEVRIIDGVKAGAHTLAGLMS